MKKPTSYLPLFGNDFFEAIAGYSDTVGLGYLRALWHYWSHTTCEGLPDDDEYLRRICCVDVSSLVIKAHTPTPATQRIYCEVTYSARM